jgi:hypothetical protein
MPGFALRQHGSGQGGDGAGGNPRGSRAPIRELEPDHVGLVERGDADFLNRLVSGDEARAEAR